jgi:hypothetical protein
MPPGIGFDADALATIIAGAAAIADETLAAANTGTYPSPTQPSPTAPAPPHQTTHPSTPVQA